MMGWVPIVFLAAVVVLGLRLLGGFRGASLQLLAAALCLALAGYARQGDPGLAGAPARTQEAEAFRPSPFAEDRGAILGRFNRSAYWLNLADSYERSGDTQTAVDLLRRGLVLHPDDWPLWIGLGNALVMHAGGMMTPAAQLAFERARQLASDHPGPPYFYALALAEGGRFDDAEAIWQDLLAHGPPGGEWRPIVAGRIAAVERLRTALAQTPQ